MYIKGSQSKLITAICEHAQFIEHASVRSEEASDLLKVLIAAAGPTRFQMNILDTRLLATETRDGDAHASTKRGAERDDGNKGACFDFRKEWCMRGGSSEFSHEKDAEIKS